MKLYRHFFTLIFLLLVGQKIFAQNHKTNIPKSPKVSIKQQFATMSIALEYSRPSIKSRTIFGKNGLVPFDKLWRTGASAATKIHFSEKIWIEGKPLPKGSYAILSVPGKEKWTIHFYTYNGIKWKYYKDKEPVLSVNIKPIEQKNRIESLNIYVNNLRDNSATIDISWENTLVPIQIASIPMQEVGFNSTTIISSLKELMWKGEIYAKVKTDTIVQKEHIYGLGPANELQGEVLILNSNPFVSKVNTEQEIITEENSAITMPFIAYTKVEEWQEIEFPKDIHSLKELEGCFNKRLVQNGQPIPFRIVGEIDSAKYHIQNLTPNTKVNNPTTAHSGQVNLELTNENVEIFGFFSTKHQSVLTHHDSFIHSHIITSDESKMGHLDDISFKKGSIKIYFDTKQKMNAK